jgi:crotonobetainyl-CoA:carnitine CoA-transferase CaiB-like acyl-CoA transferase
MAQQGVLGEAPPPMSVRTSAWAIYDIFECRGDERVFVGVVSDSLWKLFCEEFGLDEFAADTSLDSNNDRVAQKERILPVIRDLFAGMEKQEMIERLERAGIPFAPINRPADLFDDPHLNAKGGLVDVTMLRGASEGEAVGLPALPLEMDKRKFGLRHDLPEPGEDSLDVLRELGYGEDEILAMREANVVRGGE